MFKQVVIGIDEETRGRDAIALAARLADPTGQVTFVHVRSSNPLLARVGGSTDADGLLSLMQAAVLESGLTADLRVITGVSPGAGLHRVAEEVGADLLVVGSSARGRVGRVFLGDTTSQALNGAACAVAIATCGYHRQDGAVADIGVAFNGSLESLAAVSLARALASDVGAQVSAFEAVEPPMYALPAGTLGTTEALTQSDLADARRRIRELGNDIEAHVACGEPVRQLAIFSDSVDLLVIGSRGYGPVGRLVHGSTTRRLARVARCPLLILPRSDAKTVSDAADRARHEHQVLAQ